MKQAILLVLLFVGLSGVEAQAVSVGGSGSTDPWTGNIDVFLGTKNLDSGDWSPADKQSEFAIESDFRQYSWPVNAVIGLRGSDAQGSVQGPGGFINVETKNSELDFGIKKIFENTTNFHPYIGGGPALMRMEVSVNGFVADHWFAGSRSADGVGIWLAGGAYWTLNRSFNIGAELRYSNADVSFFGHDFKAGGTGIGLLLGYRY